jgi:tetratricopeptide (TPR) repeat protein
VGAVVLKGPGGIGKSTITTRVSANLRSKDYDFIVIRGKTTIEQILETIAQKATASGIREAGEVYASSKDVRYKLVWYLDNFLLKQKIVIIFDNFEENQNERKGDFHCGLLREFIWFFRDALKNKETFLFFSTRYKLPGFDSPRITKEILEFSVVEFRKMLDMSNALKRLDGQSVKNLLHEIGGNPRALELLDQIAYKEFKNQDFTWIQLKDLIPELQDRIIQKKGAEDDFTPLFLDKLFSYLTSPQRQLLDILSIYRNPLPVDAITAHDVKIERHDRLRLTDLSLLDCIDNDDVSLYYVHRLTAKYFLVKMDTKSKKKYHLRSAQYFESFINGENVIVIFIDNLIEAHWHYIQAGEYDRGAGIAFHLVIYLRDRGFPQAAEALLGNLPIKKLKKKNQAIAFNHLGILLTDFGKFDEALKNFQQSLWREKGLKNKKNIAASLFQLGLIYEYKGEYEQALSYYDKAQKLFRKKLPADLIFHIDYQKGMISKQKGNYKEALDLFKNALKVSEKIGNQQWVSTCYQEFGGVYHLQGKLDKALEYYQKSLETKQRIGFIQGISYSYTAIGGILFEQKYYDNALDYFKKSLDSRERLDDRRGIAENLHQIGMVYHIRNELDKALELYEKALFEFKDMGTLGEVSGCLFEIAKVYQHKNNYDRALIYYDQSLEIKEKIGDANGVCQCLHQIGGVNLSKGNYDEALDKYRLSLELAEEIGYITGIGASILEMGQVYFLKNEYETALKKIIQAFLQFDEIKHPHVDIAKNYIDQVREKLKPDKFDRVLEEFGLSLDFFKNWEAQKQQEFIVDLTKYAHHVMKEKNFQDIETLRGQINGLIMKLPREENGTEGMKTYYKLLISYILNRDYRQYMGKIPTELKDMFEKIIEE